MKLRNNHSQRLQVISHYIVTSMVMIKNKKKIIQREELCIEALDEDGKESRTISTVELCTD